MCPGYAIGPCGDEIIVAQAVTVDLADSAWQAPVPAALGAVPLVAFVAIRFTEAGHGPVAVPDSGCTCGCTEEARLSWIRDAFRIDVLWKPPAPEGGVRPDICVPRIVPCPPSEPSPYIVLARVTLPAQAHDLLQVDDIADA